MLLKKEVFVCSRLFELAEDPSISVFEKLPYFAKCLFISKLHVQELFCSTF